MAKRTKQQQTKHNKKVKSIAEWHKARGAKVKAAVDGFDTPKSRGGRVPDLEIEKARKKIIGEVETPETIKKDEKQHEALKKSADRSKKTKFKLWVTK